MDDRGRWKMVEMMVEVVEIFSKLFFFFSLLIFLSFLFFLLFPFFVFQKDFKILED